MGRKVVLEREHIDVLFESCDDILTAIQVIESIATERCRDKLISHDILSATRVIELRLRSILLVAESIGLKWSISDEEVPSDDEAIDY